MGFYHQDERDTAAGFGGIAVLVFVVLILVISALPLIVGAIADSSGNGATIAHAGEQGLTPEDVDALYD
jgi:hypothetical protein